MNDDLQYFTLDEVASRFRVSSATLEAFLQNYPYYRICGSRKLFTEEDIIRLYEALPRPSSFPIHSGRFGNIGFLLSANIKRLFTR
jgi:hypothetical protein